MDLFTQGAYGFAIQIRPMWMVNGPI